MAKIHVAAVCDTTTSYNPTYCRIYDGMLLVILLFHWYNYTVKKITYISFHLELTILSATSNVKQSVVVSGWGDVLGKKQELFKQNVCNTSG